jgi:superfamily II DNA/RNA helicase
MNFSDLGLSADVLRAVADAGYEKPTPIQEQAIPFVLMGRDVLGSAQTGTGKTAGFTLPMIEILAAGRARARMARSLILEPTRELAAQVAENFEIYGKYHKLTKALLIGGVSYGDQDKLLDRGVDVLIATPGRLIDHFERGRILLNDVKILVIDEADRMLDMGFIPDVEKIVRLLPPLRQTLFFSATMPPEIRRLADAFLSNPKEVSVAPPASPAATVTQGLVFVPERAKREALRRLIGTEQVKNSLIFCNRKRDVDVLFRSLKRHGFNAAALHGDMDQGTRTQTLESFKRGEMQLLVCSDVAARGLDIDDMSHVFNFDVPMHAEDYIHRIGRTGRAGKSGRAFTLATSDDAKYVAAIESLLGKPIPRVVVEGIDTTADAAEAGRGHAAGGRKPRARGQRTREPRPASHRAEQPRAEQPRAEQPRAEHPRAEHPRAEHPRPSARPAREPAPVVAPQRRVAPQRESHTATGGPFGHDDPVPAFLLRGRRVAG